MTFRSQCRSQGTSALVAGVLLMIVPQLLLSLCGLATTPALALLGRFAGAMLFALGVTLFVTCDEADSDRQRRVALGNGGVDLVMSVLFSWAAVQGTVGLFGYWLGVIFLINAVTWAWSVR